MMQIEARSEVVRTSESYDAPPPRDRLPTLPEDLSEYAWIHTGPPSWSGDHPSDGDDDGGGALEAELASEQRALDELTAGLLVDLWHSDVPNVVTSVETVVDEREARILSLVDGRATIGTLLEISGLPLPDMLGILCELCARGVISLDRSQRVARRDSDVPGSDA